MILIGCPSQHRSNPQRLRKNKKKFAFRNTKSYYLTVGVNIHMFVSEIGRRKWL
jgi:hypothetical protein